MPTLQNGVWVYDPVWFCIYCSEGIVKEATKRKLGKEHIIPFGLGGNQILPRSSCKRCEKETGAVETGCLHMMLGPTRIRLNLPTRNPHDRPTTLTLQIAHRAGHTECRTIQAAEFPLVIPGLKLPAPGILTGAMPHENNVGEFWCKFPTHELAALDTNEDQAVRLAQFNNLIFGRMLAKIAHSFAVAEWGFTSFRPYLLDLILGKSNVVFHWIGGDMSVGAPDGSGLHRVQAKRERINDVEYVVVYLTLFCQFGAPEYRIVVGQWIGASK